MLKHGKPHLVIIFPQEGEDHTTSHLAEIATMRGIPVEIGTDNGRTYPFNDLQSDGYTPPGAATTTTPAPVRTTNRREGRTKTIRRRRRRRT